MARYTIKWTVPPGHQGVTPARHQGGVWSVCPVTVTGRDLLASGGTDGTVWLWDAATGEPVTVHEGDSLVWSVCPVTVTGRSLLAAGHADGTVRFWDPATGEPAAAYMERKRHLSPRVPIPRDPPVIVIEGHGAVRSVCPVTVAGRNLLAAGGDDMTVRVWDPATREQVAVLSRRAEGYWDGGFRSVCPVTLAGRDLLAAGDADGMVWVWDPAADKKIAVRQVHHGGVESVCAVTVAGRNLLASGSWDGTLLVWDPAADEVTPLKGDGRGVLSVCPVTVTGRGLLASGGEGNMVRVWDPATAESSITIPTTYRPTAVHEVATLLAIGHDRGVLVIDLRGRANR